MTSQIIKTLKKDFLTYSNAHKRRLNKAIGPFFMLGLHVVWLYRMRRFLNRLWFPGKILSAFLGLVSNLTTGCFISAKAEIGGGLKLPHPIGIIIGDEVKIGEDVTIYQGVTLGSRFLKEKSYPTVADGAVIFPNSVIVGSIAIGRNATIGAGSIVLKSVPADRTAVGNPARILDGKETGSPVS